MSSAQGPSATGGMMRNLRNRLMNRFDRALLSGSFSAVFMLFAGTAVLIFVGSTIVRVSGIHATRDHLNFVDSMWEILQRAIDPGQLAGEQAWSSRLILLTVTIFGLLLVSTLISIINSSLERRIEGVRRGRRPVHLHNHVVVIGWNDAASKLMEELAVARIEGVDVSVVVFTEKDPIELLNYITEHIHREDEIDQSSDTARNVAGWVTVRRADGDNTNDLLTLGRIDEARAVICLLDNHSEHGNTRVVLAILAALQLPQAQRRSIENPLQVIAQFDSEEIAERFSTRIKKVVAARQDTFGGLLKMQVITPALVRNKIEVNVVRSRGLSAVYKDLLDFEGDEIYVVAPPHPDLTFGSLMPADRCIPIGFADESRVELWPQWDDEANGRSIVVVGESMNSVRRYMNSWSLSPSGMDAIRTGRDKSQTPEHYLFIGHNKWLTGLIRELSLVVPSNSTATLLLHSEDEVERMPHFAGSIIDTVIRSAVNEPLDDDSFAARFDHVIVMADHEVSEEESDAKVLTDVLACRVHLESRESHLQPMTVVAELRQRASKHIAAVRMADDLLVSEALTACAMAQFALYPENGAVLRHLLGGDSPVFLQGIPASEILVSDETLSWSEVQKRLRVSTGEIGLAIRTINEITGIPFVQMNPNNDVVVSKTDDVVVLTRLNSNVIEIEDGRE